VFRLWVKLHVVEAVNWVCVTVIPPPPPPPPFRAYEAVKA
jgi:hypothetical protein